MTDICMMLMAANYACQVGFCAIFLAARARTTRPHRTVARLSVSPRPLTPRLMACLLRRGVGE